MGFINLLETTAGWFSTQGDSRLTDVPSDHSRLISFQAWPMGWPDIKISLQNKEQTSKGLQSFDILLSVPPSLSRHFFIHVQRHFLEVDFEKLCL